MASPGPSAGPAGAGLGGPGGAGGAAPVSPRQMRRGPAPFASFDHDVSDEVRPDSSPDKPTFQLPEILEHSVGGEEGGTREGALAAAAAAGRARSASTPGPPGAGALQATPRIDISRASSSSHHDSRDSSPELALFAADPPARLEAAFREDAQDLRSSTEELAFLEQPTAPPPAPAAPPPRRHSRKDSQGSEAALLGVGRSSRLSSVGSQCSALSGYSRASRLSVASGASRSPSPHKMLLETSFCGPKPIDTDPELCAAAVERRLLEMTLPAVTTVVTTTAVTAITTVRAEVTVEPPPAPRAAPTPAAPLPPATIPCEQKKRKEIHNRRARSRERRDDSLDKPEVLRSVNRSKDIIRIKLRPDDESEDHGDEEEEEPPPKPASLELRAAPPRESRSPSPAPGAHSRKSSFCSLFKSRETIASPESPAAGRGRRRSPDRSRSKSRERSSARGSVLSLFRGARRSRPASPAEPPPAPAPVHVPPVAGAERLPYYEPAAIIHIPLRTPPEGQPAPRPASAAAALGRSSAAPAVPLTRTVLPDGSIIIPLHSPTELNASAPEMTVRVQVEPTPPATSPPVVEPVTQQQETVTIEAVPAAARSPPARSASPPPPTSPPARRARLLFSTQVGSREQVFSTQLSITSTPSACSELSAGFPEPPVVQALRDTHIAADPPPVPTPQPQEQPVEPFWSEGKDSSESSASSEGKLGVSGGGEDAEQRGLVVQESFEELPYVPTTLPLERPVALPMVPVRDRGGLRVTRVERPRPSALPHAPPTLSAPVASTAPSGEKLRISLPRRPRAASAPVTAPRAPAPAPDWIDFEELPERRAPPKRIQTLPAGGEEPLYSYVEPEHCRCECHAGGKEEGEEEGATDAPH